MRDLLILVAVASLSLAWASAAIAEKRHCLKEVVSVEGVADVASKLSRESAIAAWRRHVSSVNGESFAVWQLAKDARVACDKPRRLNGKCMAHARPCKDRFLQED